MKFTASHLRALCYSDIFDYPLTATELTKFSIAGMARRIDQQLVTQTDGLHYLSGRRKIVAKRKKRNAISRKKIQTAQRIARYFTYIPTIRLFALSGSVAAGNASENDDIDTMIVTSGGWLWTTRIFVILLAELLRVRRRPHDAALTNKLCFNMFLDENHLAVPVQERDVFSANEVVRVQILWSRGDVADQFRSENRWVNKFLPHYPILKTKKRIAAYMKISAVEWFFQHLQLHYMHSKITNEVIRDGYIRFHPHDARIWILKEYKKRLRKVGLE